MSPASQGVLEVERYIGSCLISSNVSRAGLHGKPVAVCRKQEQPAVVRGNKARGCYNGGQSYSGLADQPQCQVPYGGPGGWTGAPLISMTSSPRRCNQRSSPSLGQQQQQQQTCQTDQQQSVPTNGQLHKNPLSRLAIHTQGAPLILAGRFYNRGKLYGNSSGNNGGNSNGSVNAVCANVTSNYAHNSTNVSVTSNANGATRCPASRIAAQRPTEATAKKPPTTTTMTSSNPKTNSDCSSAAGKENTGPSSIANIDSLSIASDESSGSNNSENSLPRIIKPRKRRKKDRKPPNNVVVAGVDVAAKAEESATQRQQQSVGCGGAATEQSGVKSYAPACYEPRIYETSAAHLRNYRRPPVGHRENIYGGCRAPSMQQTELADVRQQRYAAHHRHHVQVKVLDDNRNVVAPPPMRAATAAAPPLKGYHRHHHVASNGNGNCNGNLPRRYAREYANADSCEAAARGDGLGPCQCRYCDPAGLIWDVDRNGYSPFLTAPPPPPPPPSSSSSVEYCRGGHHFGQIPLFLTPQCSNLQERALDRLFDEDPRSHDDRRNVAGPAVGPGGVILRRSWSDPTSYFSYGAEEIAVPTRDVGVIGDRGGQFEGGKHKRTLWRGDSIGSANSSASANASPNTGGGLAAPPKGLEVFTEIITLPNGHRDLEIKFYSSPSPVERLVEEDKSSSASQEADDDDQGDDDFSDIWSYHESKLQQDFRTLLQAEE